MSQPVFLLILVFALEPTTSREPVARREPQSKGLDGTKLCRDVEAAVRNVKPPVQRARLLGKVGLVKAQEGDRSGSADFFRQAIKVLESADKLAGSMKAEEWRRLVGLMADSGDLEQALRITKQLSETEDEGRVRETVLLELLRGYCRKGNGNKALVIADTMKPTENHFIRYVAISVALAKAGYVSDALKAVKRITNKTNRLTALIGDGEEYERGIAQYQAQYGDLVGALTTVTATELDVRPLDEMNQDKWRMLVLIACAQIGDYQSAKKLIRTFSLPPLKELARVRIATLLGETKRWREALILLGKVERPDSKCAIMGGIALGQSAEGLKAAAEHTLDSALQFARSVKDGESSKEGGTTLSQYCVASTAVQYAKVGLMEKALRTAEQALPNYPPVFAEIAKEQGLHGDIRGAIQTVKQIEHDDLARGDALNAIAYSATLAGRGSDALICADSLRAPYDRAMFLLGLLEGSIALKKIARDVDAASRP